MTYENKFTDYTGHKLKADVRNFRPDVDTDKKIKMYRDHISKSEAIIAQPGYAGHSDRGLPLWRAMLWDTEEAQRINNKPTPAPVTEAPPEWSPSPGNSANEAAGDVPDNFWSHDSSKSFWDSIKGSPDAPDTAPGTAPGISNSFNTNTNQSLNQNVTGDDNFIINNAGGNGRKRRSFNKLGANDFLQDFMGKNFSKNFNSGLFS